MKLYFSIFFARVERCLQISLTWYLFSISVLRQAFELIISIQLPKFCCNGCLRSLKESAQKSECSPSPGCKLPTFIFPCPGNVSVNPTFMAEMHKCFPFFRTKSKGFTFPSTERQRLLLCPTTKKEHSKKQTNKKQLFLFLTLHTETISLYMVAKNFVRHNGWTFWESVVYFELIRIYTLLEVPEIFRAL